MAEMYSAKWVFFGAVVLNIFGTLLGPVTATAGYYYFLIVRVLMGLGELQLCHESTWETLTQILILILQTSQKKGRGCGLVVSVLDIYSGNPSSILAADCTVLRKDEIK